MKNKENQQPSQEQINTRIENQEKPPLTSERAKAQMAAGKKQMAEWLSGQKSIEKRSSP